MIELSITSVLSFLTSVSNVLPMIGVLCIGLFVAYCVLRAVRTCYGYYWQISQPRAYLKLTPPSRTLKNALATQELFTVLHSIGHSRSLLDRLTGRRSRFALEITSTRAEGIQYIIGVAPDEQESIQRVLTSYLPEVKVAVLPSDAKRFTREDDATVVSFFQDKHFAFPLLSQNALTEHDPIAYVTGAMTQLEDDERITYQLILTPKNVSEARSIAVDILSNEHMVTSLNKRSSFGVVSKFFSVLNTVIYSLIDGLTSSSSSTSNTTSSLSRHKQEVAMKLKPARVMTSFEQELIALIHHKVNQPLFQANVRIAVTMNSKQAQKERVRSMKNVFASFNSPGYQSLRVKRQYCALVTRRFHRFLFQTAMISPFIGSRNLFAASEISDLFHFPFSDTTNTENVVTSLSRVLPAPLSLKNDPQLDITIGVNEYHGTVTPIGLTAAERERHMYVIGGTGNGKTTLLQYAIVQDIQNGHGLAVIDPHGDMAEKILEYIPPERVKHVIYFNPDDLDYPIGMNLLELTPGLSGNDLLREKDLITESVVSIFRKIFSDDDGGGHRIEYVLRNAIHTALTQENATLFTIYDLLNDASYRKKVVAQLEDQNLKNFWNNELGKAGEMQRVKMAVGITAKIGRFLFSASARKILEQPRSTIDFDDIINSGKILICNFSKGLLGEDTSELFGITVLAKLQLAALRRARITQDERTPFYLYVDEFQNFATTSFVQMLSEARKYKLFLVMAEQSTSQQDDQKMVNIILANVGTVIAFRTGNPADEESLLPLFSPYVKTGDIANLAPYTFYIRLAAVKAQEALSGKTLLLSETTFENKKTIIEHTRMLYTPIIKSTGIRGTNKKPYNKSVKTSYKLPGSD